MIFKIQLYSLPVQAKINFTLSLDVSRKRAYFTPTVRAQSASFTLSPQRHCLNYEFSIEVCWLEH